MLCFVLFCLFTFFVVVLTRADLILSLEAFRGRGSTTFTDTEFQPMKTKIEGGHTRSEKNLLPDTTCGSTKPNRPLSTAQFYGVFKLIK